MYKTSLALIRYSLAVVLLGCTAPLAIAGNGASRQLAISPGSLNFGSVTVGASTALSVTVSNSGSGNLNLKQASISGAGFSWRGPMLPLSLAGGKSASFTVTFAPTAAGAASGTLSFWSNATNSPASVALAGSGTTGTGQLTPNPASVNFGSVTVGTSSALPVMISNTGTASASISQNSVSGSGFSVGGPALPVSLAPGQSVSLTVSYTPTAAGTSSGQLTVSGNAVNSPLGVPVAGSAATAYGQIAANPGSLSFGSVTVGLNSTQSVVISNSGTGSASISQANVTGAGFSISGLALPLTLAPGQSASFGVTFAPSATGSVAGSVSLVSNASNSPTGISLSGTGATASGQLATSPASLSFGNVTTNTSSTLPVTLSNTGAGSATVSQATLSNTNYSLSGLTLPLTLAAGQSTSFSVNFDPGTTGTITGSLSLVSNASNSPTAVALSGSGVLAHSVNLSWTGSTSTVSGYNIYRSGQSGGPYTRMNSTLDTSTVYSDASVTSGQTYYYVTTAVDASGNESVYSNQAQAVIPTP